VGGPGSGPKKGQKKRNRYKSFEEAAGYEPEFVPPTFDREIIKAIGVFSEDGNHEFPRSGNRKYKFEMVGHLLDEVVRGVSIRIACDAVGLDTTTYFAWVRNRPDFADLVTIAEGLYATQIEKKLYEIGMRDDNVLALIAAANNKLRKYGWGKDTRTEINIHLEGAADVNHILSDPQRILEANRHEAELQRLEDEAIEGKFRVLPKHDEEQSE
jgi:hypothetical protein